MTDVLLPIYSILDGFMDNIPGDVIIYVRVGFLKNRSWELRDAASFLATVSMLMLNICCAYQQISAIS